MVEGFIESENITNCYEVQRKTNPVILEDMNFSVQEGEFVSVLGHSSSIKSTIPRIIAGLNQNIQRTVSYLGQPICGANPDSGMTYQSFALLPWLTVLENIMSGVQNRKIPSNDKKAKAQQIIGMLGLAGLEGAYPKEISGEMRHRVGLGRALVSDPDVLLMDEPFSALDIVTAEKLRSDIMDLWLDKKISTKSIIMITQAIEEAVYMSDRAVIISSDPAKIIKDFRIDIPRYRDKNDPAFLALVDQINVFMTKQKLENNNGDLMDSMQLVMFPDISIEVMVDFLELLHNLSERTDLYQLADRLMMNSREFFHIVDGVALLGFAQVQDGDIELTEAGKQFARATACERKKIFREQLVRYVPMINQMLRFLDCQHNTKMNIECFEDILKGYFSKEQARGQLDILIRWGRYAELFAYDEKSRQLYIDQNDG